MTTEPTKRCSKCGETKPTTAFYKNRGMKDGFSHWCKACWNKLATKRTEKAALSAVDNAEQKAIAKRFILSHLAQCSEACDLFFSHRIRYDHPCVSNENVTRAINDLIRTGELKATRFDSRSGSRQSLSARLKSAFFSRSHSLLPD